MTKKRPKIDSSQTSIDMFEDDFVLDTQIRAQIQQSTIMHVSHENHIEDSKILKDDKDSPILRSEQIHISKNNYPTISDSDSRESIFQSIDVISGCNHKSKNIFNQCLYEIRMSFFNKINDAKDKLERDLRTNIRSILNKYQHLKFESLKTKNYKNSIYKLLDQYFKLESKNRDINSKENDNYSWSPQSAQQIIDISVEAWLDNDLATRDYNEHPEHRADYTGKPGLCNYRKSNEYISVFTNQQCKIDTKSILITESMHEQNLRHTRKNFLIFPDHLRIKPIETRLSDKTDLREVRIIPQTTKGSYKVELVYKKVIDKVKIKLMNLDPNRIIGIDTGQENIVTIANNIGKSPMIIKGGIILSTNQWFDKIGAKSYSIYYRQQKHGQQKHGQGKKEPIIMGEKMRILSSNRMNSVLDILHKISRYLVNYCINNRIGTIVWGRNPGWKQNINLGKKTNQKFTKIPHYLLFQLLKYKAEEIGIKVTDVLENHTSKCSFLDSEPIGHKEKGQYFGIRGKKYPKKLGRSPKEWLGRGLFRTLKGIIINSDVNAAYNMIRKVFPDAFNKFIRNGKLMFSATGIAGVLLHPERIIIKDLLS